MQQETVQRHPMTWNVTDANENQMEFLCGDGLLRIEIQKAQ